MDCNNFDYYCTVSGDGIFHASYPRRPQGLGLFYEMLNGIMSRKDWEEFSKKTLCVIPAGSGNALASAAGAFTDPLHAAMSIVHGTLLFSSLTVY